MNRPRIEQVAGRREAGLCKVSFCPRRTKFCWWGQGSPQAPGSDRMLLWESKADVREERMQIHAELTPLEMALGFPVELPSALGSEIVG